jgi:capsid protein
VSDPLGNYSVVAAPSPSRDAGPAVPRGDSATSGRAFAVHSRPSGGTVRGRYDAAQTTDENIKQWSYVDGLSAKAANSKEVRTILRNRSRYEVANNCYASGIVETLADDLVGPGPGFQSQTGDDALDSRIETEFSQWALAVYMADKLHTLRESRSVDGEGFLFFETDRDLGTIQLDLRLYEAEQVATPYPYPLSPLKIDGVTLNESYKPISYDLLHEHPGDDLRFQYDFEFSTIPAKYVIHWFQRRRPHQFRGVPELTPALPLFSQLRRFTLAVLGAAEVAADFSAIIHSDLPPNSEFREGIPFESFDIERRMMMTLPAGWKMSQFIAQQPSATYEMFKKEILNEIARALKVPFSIAAGNSSGYNYASGRLDHQTYYRSLGVDQYRLETEVLDRIYAAWLEEVAMVTDWLPQGLNRPGGYPHRWLWQGFTHVDPLKEAKAQQSRMQSLTTTFTDECHKDGVDPISRIKTIAKDIQLFEEYGIPNPYIAVVQKPDATDAADETNPQQGGNGNGTPGNQSRGGNHGDGRPQNGHSHEHRVPGNGFHRH